MPTSRSEVRTAALDPHAATARRWARRALVAVGATLLSACGSTAKNDAAATASAGGSSGASSSTVGTGTAGASGSSGTAGASGSSGTTGASGSSGTAGASGSSGTTGASGGTGGRSIADDHPGDVGIDQDVDVVWAESFEEGSVATFAARYDQHQNDPGMTLEADVPSKSSGRASLRLLSSATGANATDFFKSFDPGYAQLYVRYYAKYQASAPWHHTGVWVGGYNPASKWPNPQAGLKPNGDDRFSVSLEPMEQGATPRMDFYNYWMKMHSWMDMPSGDTAYYGNSLIHQPTLTAKDAWQCIELHIKLNADGASGAGAELGVWLDDVSIAQFTDTAPLGYWIKDKFCPDSAPGTDCTDYRPANPTLVPLDLQYRSTTALTLNAFWPQNYITDNGDGSVWYDDMVVARRRIGCIR